MSNLQKIITYYQTLPSNQSIEYWDRIMIKGIKIEFLRDIILFYFHNKKYSPPSEKAFDTLMLTFNSKSSNKKIKSIIFQIIEEMCFPLQNNILETISFSSNESATCELLNTILIGGFVAKLDNNMFKKLFSMLSSPNLTKAERGKLLSFLVSVATTSFNISPAQSDALCEYLMILFSSKTSTFNNTPRSEYITILSQVNNKTNDSLDILYCFSLIKRWILLNPIEIFERPEQKQFAEIFREYCNCLSDQCLKHNFQENDISLQKAILCEILDIQSRLVEINADQIPNSIILVKRIYGHVYEKFKSNYQDISIFIRVLKCLLNFGNDSDYHSQNSCKHFLSDVVYRSYSSGLAAFDIIRFLLEYNSKLSALEGKLLERFFPNIFKLLACHPSLFVEEMTYLIPCLISRANSIELFHSLIDLPLLSATLLLHQAPAVLHKDQHAIFNLRWSPLLEEIRNPTYRPTFNYLIRKEAGYEFPKNSLLSFMTLLGELASHPLVITCGEIVPLILRNFFLVIEIRRDAELASALIPVMLDRLSLIYSVPRYSFAIRNLISDHLKNILDIFPQMICKIKQNIIQFIANLDNVNLSYSIYSNFIWSIGEYVSPNYSNFYSENVVLEYYETLECILYENLTISKPNERNLNLVNILSSTLSKLATRCNELLPRVLITLEKVRSQIKSSFSINQEIRETIFQKITELLSLLRDPSIAYTVFSSSQDSEAVMNAVVKILEEFTLNNK